MNSFIEASGVFDKILGSTVKEEDLAAKRYKTFSFIRDPFWTTPIYPVDPIEELFVNRVEEAKRLAHFLASIMSGEENNLAMVGPQGIGKTSLLTLVFDRLTEYEEKSRSKTGFSRKLKWIAEKLDLIYLPLYAFDKSVENNLATMMEEDEDETPMLLLLEFCEYAGIRLLEELSPLKHTFKPGKRNAEDTLYSTFFNTYEKLKDVAPFIGSISTFAWAIIKQEYQRVYETFFSPEKCKVLIIKQLEEDQISDLLKRRINSHRTTRARRTYKMHNPYPFTGDTISLIAKSSEGFPSIALELAGKSLEKALKTNAKIVDEYIVEAGNFSFSNIRKQVDELDASQEQVLKTIIGLGGSASATMIEKYVNVSRPAVIAIIKKLDELKIVERKPSGREVMFNLKMGVREAWETRVQNKLEL